MLNTHHLITFKALVETGSFTQTAQQLGLTQPAVSQHIKKLEQILGALLVIRHGRTTELTNAGDVLFQHVKNLEACYEGFMKTWQQDILSNMNQLAS
ncbi:MAG: LysR family transcriptional regulator [Marinomonas sp.]